MQQEISYEERIDQLKREIALLQWDLPNIKDLTLKSAREQKLMQFKTELSRLSEQKQT